MAFVVFPPHTSSCLNILFLKTRSRVVFGHRISVMTTRAMLLMTLITMIMTMMTTVVYEGGVKVSAASSCIGATLNSTIVCCSDVLHVFNISTRNQYNVVQCSEWVSLPSVLFLPFSTPFNLTLWHRHTWSRHTTKGSAVRRCSYCDQCKSGRSIWLAWSRGHRDYMAKM